MIGWNSLFEVIAVISALSFSYLLLVRPQLRRQTAHQQFLASLRVGDQVATRAGLIGRIVEMDDGPVLEIELCSLLRVRTLKNSIDERVP